MPFKKSCDITFGLCHRVALSSSAAVNNTRPETDVPPAARLSELNTNIRITVAEKKKHTHRSAFRFTKFFKNSVKKNVLYYNEKNSFRQNLNVKQR